MMRPIPDHHALKRMFQGMTEYTFNCVLGVADAPLIDYVAQLLVRFFPSEAVWSLRDVQGRRLDTVAAMITEAQTTTDEARKRDCYRHVGDYTLFWLGVYPESLERSPRPSAPGFGLDYRHQGKRSYLLASTLQHNPSEAAILRRLSDEFELCTYGLTQVRKEWERKGPDGSGNAPSLIPIL